MSQDMPKPAQVATLLRLTGWTQTDLAASLGVSQASVSKWLSGAAPMRGPFWWVMRMDAAAERGVVQWPPPTFAELVTLLSADAD